MAELLGGTALLDGFSDCCAGMPGLPEEGVLCVCPLALLDDGLVFCALMSELFAGGVAWVWPVVALWL